VHQERHWTIDLASAVRRQTSGHTDSDPVAVTAAIADDDVGMPVAIDIGDGDRLDA